MTKETYLVINAKLRDGTRTGHPSTQAAVKHAVGLLERDIVFERYHPPRTVLIVKIVGVVELHAKPRKLKKGDIDEGE